MIICPICKVDISDPVQQHGGKPPICRNCYSNGLEWAVKDPFILNELKHGQSLDDATDLYARTFEPEKDEGFMKFLSQISLVIEDS